MEALVIHPVVAVAAQGIAIGFIEGALPVTSSCPMTEQEREQHEGLIRRNINQIMHLVFLCSYSFVSQGGLWEASCARTRPGRFRERTSFSKLCAHLRPLPLPCFVHVCHLFV